jgi:hypothetical protein
MSDILPEWLIITTASVLMLFSVFCFSAAVWRHLYPEPPPPVPDATRIHPALLIFDECIFIRGFDCGANRHLVPTPD